MSGEGQGVAIPVGEASIPREKEAVWGRVGIRMQPFVGLVVPAALILIWQVTTQLGLVKPWQLPPPLQVLDTLLELVRSGELAGHIGATALRVLSGFLIGGGFGLIVGAAVGFFRSLDRWIDPTLQAIRAVPSLAWVPLLLLWMGIDEAPKITLISIGIFFPVYLNVVSGILGVSRKLVEVGEIYGLSRVGLIRRVILPAAMPSFLVGLRSGLGVGWLFVVAAEMIAAHQGLGFLLTDGREMTRPDVVLVSLVLFAVIGKFFDALLKQAEKRLLHWQDGFVRR